MAAENVAVVRRCVEEMWNQRKAHLADSLYTSDYDSHDPTHKGLGTGPGSVKKLMHIYLAAFPDIHFTINDIFGFDDKVMLRFTAEGTQRGDVLGITATNREVTVSGMVLCRMSNGKVAETWMNWDTFGMIRQLTRALTEAASKPQE